KASGSALPKRASPTATTELGAGSTFVISLSRQRTCGGAPYRSTAEIGTLEYDGCTERGRRSNDRLAHVLGERDSASFQHAMKRVTLAHRKAHGGKPRARCAIGRIDAEARPEGGRIHDPDVAARRRRSEHARARVQLPLASESGEENMMVGRVLRDQHCAR